MINKKLNKKIFRKVRNANIKYDLIEDGDRVAVGVSGGKDSLVLLHYLYLLNKYTPLNFTIIPVYLDLGLNNNITDLYNYCKHLDLELLIEKTNISYIVFDIRQEKNPCSLCSNLRRGALNRVAKKHCCNKVALGHHLDDAVNTLFMSILNESRYHVFKPRTYLDRMDITIIRPLIYVEEQEIEAILPSLPVKPLVNNCPADGYTQRDKIKNLVSSIEKQYPGARKKFLAAIENVCTDSFW